MNIRMEAYHTFLLEDCHFIHAKTQFLFLLLSFFVSDSLFSFLNHWKCFYQKKILLVQYSSRVRSNIGYLSKPFLPPFFLYFCCEQDCLALKVLNLSFMFLILTENRQKHPLSFIGGGIEEFHSTSLCCILSFYIISFGLGVIKYWLNSSTPSCPQSGSFSLGNRRAWKSAQEGELKQLRL